MRRVILETTKVVIGVAGPNGAGKGTFIKLCAGILRKAAGIEAKSHCSGDVLMSCLRLCNLPETRPNAQKFVEIMEMGFAPGFLSNAMRNNLLLDASPCVFFDGVRLPSDVLMLGDLNDAGAKSFLVHLSADADKRFGRMRKRKEKAGESELTLEQFLEQESAMTEKFMAYLKNQADRAIDNSGAIDELEKQAGEFCANFVLPLFEAPH